MSKRKVKQYTPSLNLIDVNNILHIGNHRFRKYHTKDSFKIPTGAMYMLLNLLRRKESHPTKDIWVFCFDRKSYRKDLGSQIGIGYKDKREKMPAHIKMQSDELFKWLPKIGYPVAAVDGLEADDIINSLATFAKQTPLPIKIFSTDRDSAYLVDEQCVLVSSNSRVASVNKTNYESTVGRGNHLVVYNTILLYKVICGDTSDGVPAISKESYALYRRLIRELEKIDYPVHQLNEFDKVEECIGLLEDDLKQKALDNWEIIKPHILTGDEIPNEWLQQEINYDMLKEFCAIFGMQSIAKKFGVTIGEYPKSITKYRADLRNKLAATIEGENKTSYEILNETLAEQAEVTSYSNELERLKAIEEVKTKVQDASKTILAKNNETLSEPNITSSKDAVDG